MPSDASKRSLRRLARLAMLLLCAAPASGALAGGSGGSELYGEPIRLGEGNQWMFYPLIVDIDADGAPDIVGSHRVPLKHNSLHIWRQGRGGDFHEIPQTWPTPRYSGLAAGDINDDGHLDLFTASHFGELSTYLGDGKGQFTHTMTKMDQGYSAAALVDLDKDGHLDAVALGDRKAGIEIYRGDGTGNWTFLTRLSEGNIGREIAVADLDGDGHLDIALAGGGSSSGVYYGDGSGSGWTRSPASFESTTRMLQSVAVGDFNGDGRLDIAWNGGSSGRDQNNGPDVYLNDGKRGWKASSEGLKTMLFTARGIAVGDIDKDGHLDVVAAGNVSDEIDATAYGLFLYKGDGKGGWKYQPDSGLPAVGFPRPYGVKLGDLNADGALDIVVSHGDPEEGGGLITVWMHR